MKKNFKIKFEKNLQWSGFKTLTLWTFLSTYYSLTIFIIRGSHNGILDEFEEGAWTFANLSSFSINIPRLPIRDLSISKFE